MKITPSATPNPNARKFTLEHRFEGSHNYAKLEQAAGNALARDLFAVPGVTNVFMVANFVTVNKAPSVVWEELEPSIIQIIQRHFG